MLRETQERMGLLANLEQQWYDDCRCHNVILCLQSCIYVFIFIAVSVLSQKDVQKALSGLGILVRGLFLLVILLLWILIAS